MEKEESVLFKMRHSCEHVLAQAMYRLYPNVKMAMGPAIEDGFYGDFELPEGTTISTDDFPKIEKEMNRIIESGAAITRKEISIKEAKELFKDNEYKQDWIEAIEKRGENPTVYWTGDEFVDLCAGPHVENVKDIKAFKLTNVAGAYWHGDSNNKMLTRIYGTAFESKKDMDAYFALIEEAKKRDHRKIGKEMDLFHFEPDYAPGSVFWHNKGLRIYRRLIEYMRKRQDDCGYEEISTPEVMDRVLWEISGHWAKYGAHNYSGKTQDGKEYCIKPMNCPGGMLVFKQGIRSYRDLPIKMAEFGKVHRYEASGTLSGLQRVREFTQDDAHIFCTPEQFEEVCISTLKLIIDIYKDFGFNEVKIYLATRPDSEFRIGSDEVWDYTEKALSDTLTKYNYDFQINPGEGAFYGPKLELHLKDALGRSWQCGTIQVDMSLPERFDLSYVGEDNQKHRPMMIHRALFGSIERFLGIFIENCEGKFPLWISPLPVVVASVSEDFNSYAIEVKDALRKAGVYVEADLSSEKIGYKVREHTLSKTPIIAVVGAKERDEKTVTLRYLGSKEQKTMPLNDFVQDIANQVRI